MDKPAQCKLTHVNSRAPQNWIPSQQNWTWIISVTWIILATIWPPFGLFGFVCMFTPIILALTGWGKMSCARICPRGSFIGKFTRPISLGLTMPQWMRSSTFKLFLFCVMMGSFFLLLAWAIPLGVYMVGRVVLFFMVRAAAVAFITCVIFKPRSWCTICPMGYTSEYIRDYMVKRHDRLTGMRTHSKTSPDVFFNK